MSLTAILEGFQEEEHTDMSRRLEQIPVCFLRSVGDRLGHQVGFLVAPAKGR